MSEPYFKDYDLEGAIKAGLNSEILAENLVKEYQSQTGKELNTEGFTDDEVIALLTGAEPDALRGILTELGASTLEMGPAVGMALTGGRLGSIGGIPGAIGGTLAGGVAGFFMGEQLEDLVYGEGQRKYTPGARPFAEAAKTFGSGIPFAFTPYGLPRQTGLKFVDTITKTAREQPKVFLTAEGGMLGYASAAGGLSEMIAPGELKYRIPAEIVGGTINLASLVSAVSDPIKKLGAAGLRRLGLGGEEALQTDAANTLFKILDEAGDDPNEIIRLINENENLSGVADTLAQRTGNRTLAALQNELMSRSPNFKREVVQRTQDSLKALTILVNALEGSGDPQNLRLAAEMRYGGFRNILAQKFADASVEADKALARAFPDTAAPQNEVGEVVKDYMQAALREARAQETKLWNAIDKDVDVGITNLKSALRGLKDETVEEFPLEQALDSVRLRTLDAEALNANELYKLRSGFLEEGRDALAQNNSKKARRYFAAAEAILDDLDASATGDAAYQTARQFSRALNDTFTGTFPRQIVGTKKGGVDIINPELLVHKTFTTGGSPTALRFKQMEAAVDFMKDQGFKEVSGLDDFKEVEAMLVREALEKVRNPDGSVDPTRLQAFMRQNKEVLDFVPDIRKDLNDLLNKRTSLEKLEKIQNHRINTLEKKTIFGKLISDAKGYDNPNILVAEIISKKNPTKDLKEIIRIAKRGGPEAVEGLYTSLFDSIYTFAGGKNNKFSFDKFYNKMFTAPKGQSDIATILASQGIISPTQKNYIKDLFKNAKRIEESIISRGGIEGIDLETPGLVDLVARIVGARFGAQMGGGTVGAPLVAAGAGSRFIRNILDKVPNSLQQDFLSKAMLDPEFAKILLKKGVTESEKIFIGNQIRAYIGGAFSKALEDEFEGVDLEAVQTFLPQEQPQAQPVLQPAPPPPAELVQQTTQQTPFVIQPPAQGSSLSGIDISQILREEEQRKLLGLER